MLWWSEFRMRRGRRHDTLPGAVKPRKDGGGDGEARAASDGGIVTVAAAASETQASSNGSGAPGSWKARAPITTAIVRTSTFMTIRHAAHLGSCADTGAGQAGSALVVSLRASSRMRR